MHRLLELTCAYELAWHDDDFQLRQLRGLASSLSLLLVRFPQALSDSDIAVKPFVVSTYQQQQGCG